MTPPTLPYGDKSADAIRYYCLRIVKFLLEKNCKMIVVACNSASSAAYNVLLDFFESQALFVNVVDPLVVKVSEQGYQKVGVIATKATVRSDIYRLKLLEASPGLKISSLATPLLVLMIEEGYFNNDISQAIIAKYLSDPALENINALLLACTHYPLIRPAIQTYFEDEVEVYDSNDVVARAVRDKLIAANLLNDQKRNENKFYVSDFTQSFEETTRMFYDEKIHLEHTSIW